jgi:hypothetical protein
MRFDKDDKELMEMLVTMKAQKKADELGVKFKVVYKLKEYCPVIMIRIKNDSANIKEFVDYIGDLIIENKYSREVQYTYPSRL